MSIDRFIVYGNDHDLKKIFETFEISNKKWKVGQVASRAYVFCLGDNYIDYGDIYFKILHKYKDYFLIGESFRLDTIRDLHINKIINTEQIVFRVPDDIVIVNKIVGNHKKEKFVFTDLNIII